MSADEQGRLAAVVADIRSRGLIEMLDRGVLGTTVFPLPLQFPHKFPTLTDDHKRAVWSWYGAGVKVYAGLADALAAGEAQFVNPSPAVFYVDAVVAGDDDKSYLTRFHFVKGHDGDALAADPTEDPAFR